MNAASEQETQAGAAGSKHSVFKRLVFSAILAAGLLAMLAGLVELVYRFQWLDTYRPELRAYNPPEVLAGKYAGPTLLAMGDSFTAGTASYPGLLRGLLPGWRIVNGGIPGTCIVQANIAAQRRLQTFKPKVCVYQIFAGNDLFDIRYPYGGEHLTISRRIYWFLASQLRSLAFINYRLGQWRAGAPTTFVPAAPAAARQEDFSPALYDKRERLYLAAEPALLENQALVTPQRAGDYEILLSGLRVLRGFCGETNTKLLLLVVPHAAQVSPVYLDRMRQLGATFTTPERMAEPDYPFIAGIRKTFAGDTNVVVVDALPALKAAEREGVPVYFANDGHLNRAGQECVARLLSGLIK